MTGPLLSRDDVTALLEELSDELERRDVQGRMFVVGGAAMALAFGRDRLTQDVDALFEPEDVIYEAARRVAQDHPGLPDDWLNDAVKGYIPGDDPDATVYLDLPGLRVEVASPEYLFVMKALAARIERDTADPYQPIATGPSSTGVGVFEVSSASTGASRPSPRSGLFRVCRGAGSTVPRLTGSSRV